MNISESTAFLNLLAVIAPEGAPTAHSTKTFEAIDAVELLAERARKALGAGPTTREVMVRIADSRNDQGRMRDLADYAEDWLLVNDQEAAR